MLKGEFKQLLITSCLSFSKKLILAVKVRMKEVNTHPMKDLVTILKPLPANCKVAEYITEFWMKLSLITKI